MTEPQNRKIPPHDHPDYTGFTLRVHKTLGARIRKHIPYGQQHWIFETLLIALADAFEQDAEATLTALVIKRHITIEQLLTLAKEVKHGHSRPEETTSVNDSGGTTSADTENPRQSDEASCVIDDGDKA